MKLAMTLTGTAMVLGLAGQVSPAQAPAKAQATTPALTTMERNMRESCAEPGVCSLHFFHLANVTQVNESNEIITAIRNTLPPSAKIYSVPSSNVILTYSTPEDMELAQKIVTELDRPRKTYRLTYTITEMDGGKRIGVTHYSMVAAAGQAVTLKQGSKVPVATGSLTADNTTAQTQFTYLDVGMNFAATPIETATGAMLRTKIEQSGIAEEKSGVGPQDPVVRQTVIEGTSTLILGKPLMLGSIDVFGSTRHLDVEVVMDVVK